MMDLDLLNELANRVVNEPALVHDYVQIGFFDGTVLNLNNDVEIDGQLVSASKGGESLLYALIGRIVKEVHRTSDMFALKFDGGHVLTMTLKPEAWRSPEALTLSLPGQATVVLN